MALPQRPLGKTGIEVPILGYGTAPLGKIKFMDAPLIRKSAQLLNHAIDQGITYLDTSPDYGSQPKLGEVMKTRRHEVFLATKCYAATAKEASREMNALLDMAEGRHGASTLLLGYRNMIEAAEAKLKNASLADRAAVWELVRGYLDMASPRTGMDRFRGRARPAVRWSGATAAPSSTRTPQPPPRST